MLQIPSLEAIASLISNPANKQAGLSNWSDICALLIKRGANSPASLIGAAGTIAVETGNRFLPVIEYGDIAYFHKMYGDRPDYVTDAQGLWLWRGRGFIQLTGADNYHAAAIDLKVDLVNSPGLAARMPYAAQIFVWYWLRNRLPSYCNAAAQSGNWDQVRKAVNGGLNGLTNFESALKVLGAF